jgi:Amidase
LSSRDADSHLRVNRRIVRNTAWVNYLGLCAITMPVGRDRAGMPVGLQLTAPAGAEEKLLTIALAAERALGPGTDRLGTPPMLASRPPLRSARHGVLPFRVGQHHLERLFYATVHYLQREDLRAHVPRTEDLATQFDDDLICLGRGRWCGGDTSPSVSFSSSQLVADRQAPDTLARAAKMALHSAGAKGGSPGSPTPLDGTSMLAATMCTSVTGGDSSMRSTRYPS